MPAATREIKRRIRSVGNTKKVTKAMELVAASKMRRAQEAAVATRGYALRAWQLLTHLASVTDENAHPLLKQRKEGTRTLLIVLTPDKGLTGGLNTHIIKEAMRAVQERQGHELSVITVGKKGEQAMRRLHTNIIASYPNATAEPQLVDILPVAQEAIEKFAAGEVDEVLVTYANFVSVLVQKPMTRQLLPITKEGLKQTIEDTGKDDTFQLTDADALPEDLLFEPNSDAVLERVLRSLTDMQLYQMLLEATASEHSSRMMAMRSASDAAGDLIDELTLAFNKARQAGITQDLSEISASRAALAGA
jgi:F-type H+-transporting ATPase subunit gamma